jgi:hypothetical protein
VRPQRYPNTEPLLLKRPSNGFRKTRRDSRARKTPKTRKTIRYWTGAAGTRVRALPINALLYWPSSLKVSGEPGDPVEALSYRPNLFGG